MVAHLIATLYLQLDHTVDVKKPGGGGKVTSNGQPISVKVNMKHKWREIQ